MGFRALWVSEAESVRSPIEPTSAHSGWSSAFAQAIGTVPKAPHICQPMKLT